MNMMNRRGRGLSILIIMFILSKRSLFIPLHRWSRCSSAPDDPEAPSRDGVPTPQAYYEVRVERGGSQPAEGRERHGVKERAHGGGEEAAMPPDAGLAKLQTAEGAQYLDVHGGIEAAHEAADAP